MAMTLVEKIFAAASGNDKVRAGQSVELTPNLITMYDWNSISNYCLDLVEEYATLDTSKLVMFIDHKIPAKSIEEVSFHNKTLEWCGKHGVPVYQNMGIGHQLTAEMGLADPGDVVVHFDRHVNILGGLGIFSVGTRLELIMSLGTGKFPIQVPETIRIELTGKLPDGILGRDLFNHILKDQGPDLAPDKVIEFAGEGVKNVSIDSRLTVCCLAMFLGCMTAMFPPDDLTADYYRTRFNRDIKRIAGDPGAGYLKTLRYDLGKVGPMVVVPPSPKNAVSLSEAAGTVINQGYIGSCACGRLEDLAVAARVLKGRKLAPGRRLYVVPSSGEVMRLASKLGYLDDIIGAGAFVASSSCDFCSGRQGALDNGEKAMSTGPLNVPGRMGNLNADIYIGSAASVAAAVVAGEITDPREFL